MSIIKTYSLKQLLGVVVALSILLLNGNDSFASRRLSKGSFTELAEHLIHRDRKTNYRFFIIDKVNPEVDKPLYTTSGDMVFKFKFSAPGDAKLKYFAFQEARTAMEVYQLISDSQLCFFLTKKVAVNTIEEDTPKVVPRTILWLITTPAKFCPEKGQKSGGYLLREDPKLTNDEEYLKRGKPYPTTQHYTTLDSSNEEFFYTSPAALEDGDFEKFLDRRRVTIGSTTETELETSLERTITRAKRSKGTQTAPSND